MNVAASDRRAIVRPARATGGRVPGRRALVRWDRPEAAKVNELVRRASGRADQASAAGRREMARAGRAAIDRETEAATASAANSAKAVPDLAVKAGHRVVLAGLAGLASVADAVRRASVFKARKVLRDRKASRAPTPAAVRDFRAAIRMDRDRADSDSADKDLADKDLADKGRVVRGREDKDRAPDAGSKGLGSVRPAGTSTVLAVPADRTAPADRTGDRMATSAPAWACPAACRTGSRCGGPIPRCSNWNSRITSWSARLLLCRTNSATHRWNSERSSRSRFKSK